ncbi:uncharacterized protein C8Q71DRAFT_860491 [Rhodofomes roseus]|uniref:Uncharacterized protein n=1 Tax=Rhodofomes roseus TaxID=34475 RepID=A0ABQ8K8Z7_9APHY|nr:uncharacterized protein C8Q71DRAFT_860491 [Rhodofomes roseus]KAH9833221.1 hypothetical protein C8Q71DRAFT_860491 [Rhodofomes roseus]
MRRRDDDELPEYEMETIDGKTLACYIPSAVGKTFEIFFRGDTREDIYGTAVLCFIDGRCAEGIHFLPTVIARTFWGVQRPDSRTITVDLLSYCPDDDSNSVALEPHPDLGTVVVKLAYVTSRGVTGPFRKIAEEFKPGMVHERSKKWVCNAFQFLQAENMMPLDERAASDASDQAPTESMRQPVRPPQNELEAGASREMTREATPGSTTFPKEEEEDKPTIAQSAGHEDVDELQKELDSAQERVQSLQSRLQAIKASGSSLRVKREQ